MILKAEQHKSTDFMQSMFSISFLGGGGRAVVEVTDARCPWLDLKESQE